MTASMRHERRFPTDHVCQHEQVPEPRWGPREPVLLRLQRSAGNASVQRLVNGLPVQRYAVGVRRSASCEQVLTWLNSQNPHRPAWAKTTARFTRTGRIVVTGTAPDFEVSISSPDVTVRKSVDMPQWNPSDPAMASTWSAMYSTLRTHEAEHEAIADQWKSTLLQRLTDLSLSVTAPNRAVAQQRASAAVQAEWQGWLGEHQTEQNGIDPFTAVLDCPAPAGSP